MATLPLDFLSQLDELHHQDLRAREILTKERGEVSHLRAIVRERKFNYSIENVLASLSGEEICETAKMQEAEAAAAASAAEKAALMEWSAVRREEKGKIIPFSSRLSL